VAEASTSVSGASGETSFPTGSVPRSISPESCCYALSDEFADGFDTLLRLGGERRVALMCSEAVWWRCHRRIITDYLLLNGHAVDHLMSPGRTETAKITRGAQKTADGKVVYPLPTT
jgi:hypothetical protein